MPSVYLFIYKSTFTGRLRKAQSIIVDRWSYEVENRNKTRKKKDQDKKEEEKYTVTVSHNISSKLYEFYESEIETADIYSKLLEKMKLFDFLEKEKILSWFMDSHFIIMVQQKWHSNVKHKLLV